MRRAVLIGFWCFASGFAGWSQTPAPAEAAGSALEQKIARLETQVRALESKKPHATEVGAAALVSAALCALWAQNTRRNALLWFIAGFFCVPFALIALLVKNSNDNFERRTFGRAAHAPDSSP